MNFKHFHLGWLWAVTLVSLMALTTRGLQAADRKKPDPLAPIEDQPDLPRVLLIGDSISMGYTLPVRKQLEGVANVHRVPTNGGPTIRGLAEIERWLGDKPWDVIHFNWGLHDLRRDKGDPQVSLADYEKNLDQLVARLKQTGAKLIWANTTPVPAGSRNRQPGDEVKYNEAAARVMQKHGVEVNDLYAFALPRLAKIQHKADVHFNATGNEVLGEEVAGKIRAAIGTDKTNQ